MVQLATLEHVSESSFGRARVGGITTSPPAYFKVRSTVSPSLMEGITGVFPEATIR